ncbi:hypothetical protein BH24ACT22_BH24ACT22_03150 [soil metagenome]
MLMIGLGIGLASVAGIRAFMPLALATLLFQVGLIEPNSAYANIGPDGSWWAATGVLWVLAGLEIFLDKLRALERVFNIAMAPVRAFSGGLLFTWAVGADLDVGSLPWLVVGAVIAGIVAVLKVVLRPRASLRPAGVSTRSLSVFEDVVALVGAVVGFFVPLLPVLPVAFLFFFFFRINKRRGKKYGGLRILSD